jgi:hypothetical protein
MCRAIKNKRYFITQPLNNNENNNFYLIIEELTANKCQLDKETGPCYARLERYFFNKVTKKCEKFVYGKNKTIFKILLTSL